MRGAHGGAEGAGEEGEGRGRRRTERRTERWRSGGASSRDAGRGWRGRPPGVRPSAASATAGSTQGGARRTTRRWIGPGGAAMPHRRRRRAAATAGHRSSPRGAADGRLSAARSTARHTARPGGAPSTPTARGGGWRPGRRCTSAPARAAGPRSGGSGGRRLPGAAGAASQRDTRPHGSAGTARPPITGPTPIGAGRRCTACHARRAEARRAAQRERQAARRRAPRPCRRCPAMVEPPRQICSGCRAPRKAAAPAARTCRAEGCTARIDGAGASVRYCAPCRAVRAEQPRRTGGARAAPKPARITQEPATEDPRPRPMPAPKARAAARRSSGARRGEGRPEAAPGRQGGQGAGRAAVRRRIEQHRERLEEVDEWLAELEQAQEAHARRLQEAA